MSAPTTRKRARLELLRVSPETEEDITLVEPEGQEQGPVRDEEFWFEDGTIVLVAGKVEFKVYARLLVEHSPVFNDMLSLPQPSAATDASMSNGPTRPLVHLPDSPKDLRYLFEVMMPSKVLRPFGFPQTQLDFDRLSAWVRIGHKYQIDDLVQKSLEYLRQIYPSDVDVYMKSGRPAMAKQMSAIGVVNIARLTGALDLLPVALMDCCQLDSSLVKGYRRGDGTYERLSDDDLQLCFKAKGKLIEARAQLVHEILTSETSEDCSDFGNDCANEVNRYRTTLFPLSAPGLFTSNPMASLTTYVKTNMPKLCSACRQAHIDRASILRRAVFTRLPDIMGVTVKDWGKKNAPATS